MSIGKTVLHEHTEQHVAQFTAKPSHAVLLVGSNGIGKTHIAEVMVANILRIETDVLDAYPYYKRLHDEKGSISIEAVRDLQKFLQLKTPGTRPIRRAVVIEHAESLTTEAQNAFLKMLEEPPADTVILLTADSQRSLLPTILSRVQIIPMYAPEEQTLQAHFIDQGKEMQAVMQAYFLSGGLPGLMTALLDDDSQHPLLGGVSAAKAMLQQQLFERLALVEGLSKQKEVAGHMLRALERIAQTGLNQAASKQDAARVKQWHHILKTTAQARQALDQNANPKLVLTHLMLEL